MSQPRAAPRLRDKRSRGEQRGRERLHRVPAADVLDRLPDDRERRRRRGHRAGGLPAADPHAPRRHDHRLAQGVPGHGHHPAGDQPPAVRAGAARGLRRRLAARAAHRGPRARPGGARRDGRFTVDGVPRPAREPVTNGARGVPAARGVRLRVQGDRRDHRQVRAELPPDPRPGQAARRRGSHRRQPAPLRGLTRAARRGGPPVLRRRGRRRPDRAA
jgi:hypothetical protein